LWQERNQVGIARKSRIDTLERLGRDCSTAEHLGLFENHHAQSRAGKVGGGGETVVAPTHHDNISV